MQSDLLANAYEALARGWALTPLAGKVPILKAWASLPLASADDIRNWVAKGYNLGLRTGPVSNVVVVDVDPGGELPPGLPDDTPCVATPRGGRHYYFRAAAGLRNSASKLAPHVDVRGEGGQVAYPGSINPKTKGEYRWITPPGALPEFPAAWLAKLQPPRQAPRLDTYGITAVRREADILRATPEGSRNDTLVRAAYRAGQLIAGGEVDGLAAMALLYEAAVAAGLPDDEIRATLASGIQAGKLVPRRRAERVPDAWPTRKPDEYILVPGGHVDDMGVYHEQSSAAFGRAVCDVLAGHVYRRAGLAGELQGEPGKRRFVHLSKHRARILIDRATRLAQWVKVAKDDTHARVYRPAIADLGELVIAAAVDHASIGDIDHLTNYPVCILPDYRISIPGLHAGVFYDEPPGLAEVHPIRDPAEIRAVLDDLVVDFPFAAEADRQNFFGLLLTPMLRPAIRGNVPMHLITSPIERTGKTKLAEEVLGGIILGEPVPAFPITGSDDERKKEIIGLLLRGQTLTHFDNLGDFIDSPVLASLLTATTYQGRMLGVNQILSVPNTMTLVASGNNVRATGEVAKRIIPIRLAAPDERPDLRTEFRHPDLRGYVESVRGRVLSALQGLVLNWSDAGRPVSQRVMGGFEDYLRVVGGILAHAGYDDWLGNRDEWTGSSDEFGEDLARLVECWIAWAEAEHGDVSAPLQPSILLEIATRIRAFESILAKPTTDRGRLTAFGQRVLAKCVGRTVQRMRIERCQRRNGTEYRLVGR